MRVRAWASVGWLAVVVSGCGGASPKPDPAPGAGSGVLEGGTASTAQPPAAAAPAPAACVKAKLLWSEDFESGDYRQWTGQGYGQDWGNECQDSERSTETAVTGKHSQRSEITCEYLSEGGVHRAYGGIQFTGDERLPDFTNRDAGIDAPFGVVNTLWVRLDTDTVYENGSWFSFFTATSSCDWKGPDQVLGIGIEDKTHRLAAAHYQWNAGGTRTFEPGGPVMPRRKWARITIYLNYYDEVMHVWQDGVSQEHVTFDRSLKTICHFHWGLYASGDNTDVVLFEDDISVWKLGERWTDFSVEPYLGKTVPVCE